VFEVLAGAGGFATSDVEDTWNMGVGMLAMIDKDHAERVMASLSATGHRVWQVGTVRSAAGSDIAGAVTEAKGVSGGAVRLVGNYSSLSSA
jgi:phosphoribosylformylglycinamidine cyclo-ligase